MTMKRGACGPRCEMGARLAEEDSLGMRFVLPRETSRSQWQYRRDYSRVDFRRCEGKILAKSR